MRKKGDRCPCLKDCPISEVIQRIGGKWKLQIICALSADGATRYNVLKRKIQGVSNTMLAASLQELEQDGLVIREQFAEIPPRVEYRLSKACQDLVPIIDKLGEWNYRVKKQKRNTA